MSINGLLPKLIKFLAPGKPVVTYCDRDYFTGTIYEKAGFKRTSVSRQLTYTKDGQIRERRERYMKGKLPDLGIEVGDMTEKEALEQAGIYQCWNSGVERWELSAA
jgi:hypothetical protein